MKVLGTLLCVFALVMVGCKAPQALVTVDKVDVGRYAGKWYEIASFPLSAQKGCACTTATYEATDKGYIIVKNRCQDSKTGKIRKIAGKAFPDKTGNNSKLKVQFFPLIKAPYYIIALDTVEYAHAVVGTPDRNYLWILNREPQMSVVVYDSLCTVAKQLGFDIQRLQKTNQSCNF